MFTENCVVKGDINDNT